MIGRNCPATLSESAAPPPTTERSAAATRELARRRAAAGRRPKSPAGTLGAERPSQGWLCRAAGRRRRSRRPGRGFQYGPAAPAAGPNCRRPGAGAAGRPGLLGAVQRRHGEARPDSAGLGARWHASGELVKALLTPTRWPSRAGPRTLALTSSLSAAILRRAGSPASEHDSEPSSEWQDRRPGLLGRSARRQQRDSGGKASLRPSVHLLIQTVRVYLSILTGDLVIKTDVPPL